MSELTDVREMRKAITEMRYTGRDLSGGYSGPSIASMVARQCLDSAQNAGLSGEDAMTLLAFHALERLDAVSKQLLDYAALMPPSRFAQMSAATRQDRGPGT